MMAKFYGFYHTYGISVRDSDGERIGSVVVFSSRASRNKWLNNGGLYHGERCREAISAKDAQCEIIRIAYAYMLVDFVD